MITYRICQWIALAFFKLIYGIKVYGREHMIEEGGAIIAANHESFLDPPIVGCSYRQPVRFLARKTLFTNKFSFWLLRKLKVQPVDQERPDFSSLKNMVKCVKEGERVVIFPEGARTLDGKMSKAEPGLGLVISKARAPIQPVRVFGAYKALRRGAKMLSFSKITLVVGKPFTFTEAEYAEFTGKEGYRKLSERVMEEIAKLELPEGREFS